MGYRPPTAEFFFVCRFLTNEKSFRKSIIIAAITVIKGIFLRVKEGLKQGVRVKIDDIDTGHIR